MKLLSDECPGAIREQELKNLTGRKVAIDASMAMYQFLVAVRTAGNAYGNAQLTNEAGEVTSHIQGMFNRTIKLLAAGVKPVYVFDGKPPDMKSGELEKRLARRQLAEAELAKAKEEGSAEDIEKYNRRLVKVGKNHNDECKELLRLMGVPVITAPCEAEAQCAELARMNKVYATATEDMDALTFKTPKLLRKLTFSQGGKVQPIVEIDFELAISGLGLTYEEFIDLCILCGCDYCCTIKGIGPKTALKLIRQFKTIEAVVEHIKKEKKYTIPKEFVQHKVKIACQNENETKNSESVGNETENNSGVATANGHGSAEAIPDVTVSVAAKTEEKSSADLDDIELELSDDNHNDDENDVDEGAVESNAQDIVEEEEEEVEEEGAEYITVEPVYVRARQLFLNCDITPASDIELKWSPPLESELRAFLVEKMGFSEERVNNGIKRLLEAQQKKAQQRMDSFFKPLPQSAAGVKRKATAGAKTSNTKGKAAKSGGKPRR